MAGKFPIDFDQVQTATELLKSHAASQVKQHIVFDSVSRPKFIFTTYIGAQQDDPCMCDEYVYLNSSSTQVVNRQERVYKWQAAWETGALAFTFDPSVIYDSDADGIE